MTERTGRPTGRPQTWSPTLDVTLKITVQLGIYIPPRVHTRVHIDRHLETCRDMQSSSSAPHSFTMVSTQDRRFPCSNTDNRGGEPRIQIDPKCWTNTLKVMQTGLSSLLAVVFDHLIGALQGLKNLGLPSGVAFPSALQGRALAIAHVTRLPVLLSVPALQAVRFSILWG